MQCCTWGRIQGWLLGIAGCGLVLYLASPSATQPDPGPGKGKKADVGKTSYDQIAPVILGEGTFADVMAKDKANKDAVMAKAKALLEQRYDLSRKVDPKVTMTRGKPIPVGPTAKLPNGMTWEQLAAMSPEAIREKGLFPKGFLPLPHPNHPVGGMVFPQA